MGFSFVVQQIAGAARASTQMMVDDPGLFVIQLARRLPKTYQELLLRVLPDRGTRTTQVLRSLARRDLDGVSEAIGSTPHNALEANLLAAAGVDPDASGHIFPNAHARWLRQMGDIPQSLNYARPRLYRRSASAAATQVERFVLPVPRQPLPDSTRAHAHPQGVMRILHILTNSLPTTQSGYSLRSHAILRAQREAGLDARAVTRFAYPLTVGRVLAEPVQYVDDVPYYRLLRWRWPRSLPERLALQTECTLDLIRGLETSEGWIPDVIHTTTPFHNALVAQAVAKALGVPWVYELRGEPEKTWLTRLPSSHRKEGLSSWHYRTYEAKEAQSASCADAVVALSNVQKLGFVHRGVPSDKIELAPNAIWHRDVEESRSPEDRETERIEARTKLHLPSHARIFGSVSAVVEYEGFETAIRALTVLRSRFPDDDWRFVLVGDGTALPGLRKLAESHSDDVAGNIVFAGRAPRDGAATWYRALDCFIIPRIDSEVTRSVTPIKGLQAAALGVPIVASNLPALAEVTPPPPAGWLVPPESPEALAEAIDHARQSVETDPESVLRAAVGFASERTWERNAKLYETLYSRMMGAQAADPHIA
ncbi:MAG: glycosyltransferase [Actinomycetaceae bacterium]|nr:glycosyltransferase [Arcanobacterium sp.]MDD7504727.1 glycosyltransferase [Actinomycetaceae bacterium]MDY6143098.1 glycosyltransferase [Arcanobacterium sp.]